MMIFSSYKVIKSKTQRGWFNILRNYVHSRKFFQVTPKIHPPQTTLPAPPPDLASHPTRPPIPPPSQPPHPTCLLSLGHDSIAIIATRWCCPSSFCEGCMCGVQVNQRPHAIFYTPHQISYLPTPILYSMYAI